MRNKRKVFCLSILLLAIIVLVPISGYYFFIYNPIQIPSRKQLIESIEMGLLNDCKKIITKSQKYLYHLEKSQWSKSIKHLHPRDVFVAKKSITISLWINYRGLKRLFVPSKFLYTISIDVYISTLKEDLESWNNDNHHPYFHWKIMDNIYLVYPKDMDRVVESKTNLIGAYNSKNESVNFPSVQPLKT